MSRFQTEFHVSVAADTRQILHAEAWDIYSTRVRELRAGGKTQRDAEVEAGAHLESVFKKRHPEITGKWAFRVVWP